MSTLQPLLRRTTLALGVALLTLTASGCGTERLIRAATQATITETDLQEVGRESHQELVRAKLIYDEPRLAAYVSRVGQRVAAGAQTQAGGANGKLLFRFFVLDDPDYNAFAAPGGYIYITRGFLALLNTEDELAAVFGHEIAHVTAGHTLKQANAEGRAGVLGALGTMGLSVLGVLTFNPLLIGLASAGDVANGVGTALYSQRHSREHELEADRLGKGYTGLAGYTPGAPERVMNVLEGLAKAEADSAKKQQRQPSPIWGVFDSHPTNALRINALRAAPAKGQRRAPEADFLSALEGLSFGISDRVGVQRGSTFYSQGHQLVVAVPAGWDAHLSSDGSSVAFADDDETAFVFLTSQDLPTRQDAAGFAKSYFNVGNLNGSPRRMGSLNAWRGTVTPKRRRGEYAIYEGMTWVTGDRGYALVGGRSDKSKLSNEAWIKLFNNTGSSLRPLKLEEAALAKSIQLRIVTPDARKPLTYAALAQQNSLGPHTVGTLRLLNGQYGTRLEPAKAQRVKVLR